MDKDCHGFSLELAKQGRTAYDNNSWIYKILLGFDMLNEFQPKDGCECSKLEELVQVLNGSRQKAQRSQRFSIEFKAFPFDQEEAFEMLCSVLNSDLFELVRHLHLSFSFRDFREGEAISDAQLGQLLQSFFTLPHMEEVRELRIDMSDMYKDQPPFLFRSFGSLKNYYGHKKSILRRLELINFYHTPEECKILANSLLGFMECHRIHIKINLNEIKSREEVVAVKQVPSHSLKYECWEPLLRAAEKLSQPEYGLTDFLGNDCWELHYWSSMKSADELLEKLFNKVSLDSFDEVVWFVKHRHNLPDNLQYYNSANDSGSTLRRWGEALITLQKLERFDCFHYLFSPDQVDPMATWLKSDYVVRVLAE